MPRFLAHGNSNKSETDMKLVDGTRRVVAYSLSFWLSIIGLAALIGPEVRFRLTGQDYDPYLFWWISALLLVASAAGRLWKQGVSWWREWLRILAVTALAVALAFVAASEGRAAPATEEQTLEIAVPFIAKEEGVILKAYLDIVGVPTICAGSTRGVRLGMEKTMRECLDLLRSEVAEYRAKLHRFFTATTIADRLPPARDAAYTSTAFNCGIAAIGKSTATRRLNAGDIAGGCEALTWWKKAGGRVIRGLYERRKRERALCLQGI